MADITWGPEYTWPVLPAGHQCLRTTSCAIGTDKFVIAYILVKIGDPQNLHGRALVGSVSGTAITYGAEVEFCDWTWSHDPIGLCKLENNKFIIVYIKRIDGIGHAYARVGTVSGTTISWGAEVDVTSSVTEHLGCCGLSAGKFAVTYNDADAGDKGKVCICTVSGTTITPGTPVQVINEFWFVCKSIKVDTDKFVGCWTEYGSRKLLAAVFTVTGTTPSMATPVTVDTDSYLEWNTIDYLGSNKLVVAWNTDRAAVTARGLACILTVSGTSLSIGAKVETQEAAPIGNGPSNTSIVALDISQFVYVYCQSALGNAPGTSRRGAVSDTIITLGGKEIWYTPDGYSRGISIMSPGKVALVFIEGLAGPEKAKIGVIKAKACSNMVATAVSDTQIDVSWTRGIGATNTVVRRKVGAYPADVTDGDEAYNGPSDSFSDPGLDPSTAYYYRGWSYTAPYYADTYCQDNATTMALPPPVLPPTVTSASANNIDQTLSTINGALSSDGGEACDCWFEWGLVEGDVHTTPVQAGKVTGDIISAALTGLTHNTRYHFRFVAENSTGTSYGDNMYFVTEGPALEEYSLIPPELGPLRR